jgi:hypothetical protein
MKTPDELRRHARSVENALQSESAAAPVFLDNLSRKFEWAAK